MAGISSIHFDTACWPESERLDRCRAAIPYFDIEEVPGAAPGGFHARLDVWLPGDILISVSNLSAVRFVRLAAKAEADGVDLFSFLMLRKGSWSGDLDGRLLTAGPGQVIMFDLAQPIDIVGAATDSVAIRIERQAVVDVASGIELHGFMFQEALGRILADHFMMLARRLPHAAAAEAGEIAATTIGLVRACLTAAPRPESLAPQRELDIRHRVFRHVNDSLCQPGLTAEKICRDLGLSRSVLYRAFAPLGGIADYIRARRLETVHALLEDPAVDRNICDIAADYGFVSEAHFSRVFRRRYGYSPREARSGGVAPSSIAALGQNDIRP